jgi:hypothetical protein
MSRTPKFTLVITDRNEGLFTAATVSEGELCVLNNLPYNLH